MLLSRKKRRVYTIIITIATLALILGTVLPYLMYIL
jgi:hypothetical protein